MAHMYKFRNVGIFLNWSFILAHFQWDSLLPHVGDNNLWIEANSHSSQAPEGSEG